MKKMMMMMKVRMMCPGISYSTVHTLLFHSNGSVQDNKLFTEFCNKNLGHFTYGSVEVDIDAASIHNETLTLLNQPWKNKYDDSKSPITRDYEVITTFMRIHNISATWELDPTYTPPTDPYVNYQLRVGSYWCQEDQGWECCPPM